MINIENIDDKEYFIWSLVKYLHPEDHHRARIRKVDKDLATELDFKNMKFSFKIRDIHKIKKRIALTLVFLIMKTRKTRKNIHS